MKRHHQRHPEDIKALIRKRGGTLSEIAQRLGVTKGAVSATLHHNRQRSRRIEEAIAVAAGLKPATIWPDRYRRLAKPQTAA